MNTIISVLATPTVNSKQLSLGNLVIVQDNSNVETETTLKEGLTISH